MVFIGLIFSNWSKSESSYFTGFGTRAKVRQADVAFTHSLTEDKKTRST
jgi:hypothetical protein